MLMICSRHKMMEVMNRLFRPVVYSEGMQQTLQNRGSEKAFLGLLCMMKECSRHNKMEVVNRLFRAIVYREGMQFGLNFIVYIQI